MIHKLIHTCILNREEYRGRFVDNYQACKSSTGTCRIRADIVLTELKDSVCYYNEQITYRKLPGENTYTQQQVIVTVFFTSILGNLIIRITVVLFV
jgi:hypothetical protein